MAIYDFVPFTSFRKKTFNATSHKYLINGIELEKRQYEGKKGFSSFLFAQQKKEEKNLSSPIFRLGQIDFLFVFDIFSNLNPLFYGLGCRVVFDYKNERKASSLSSRNIPLHFRSSFSDLERNPFRKLQLKNEK